MPEYQLSGLWNAVAFASFLCMAPFQLQHYSQGSIQYQETQSLSLLIILGIFVSVNFHSSLLPPLIPSLSQDLHITQTILELTMQSNDDPELLISLPPECQDCRSVVTCVLFQMNEKGASLATQQSEAERSHSYKACLGYGMNLRTS